MATRESAMFFCGSFRPSTLITWNLGTGELAPCRGGCLVLKYETNASYACERSCIVNLRTLPGPILFPTLAVWKTSGGWMRPTVKIIVFLIYVPTHHFSPCVLCRHECLPMPGHSSNGQGVSKWFKAVLRMIPTRVITRAASAVVYNLISFCFLSQMLSAHGISAEPAIRARSLERPCLPKIKAFPWQ